MSFVTDHILKNPPVLLGLIAMIGLIVQRKPFAEVVKGSLTAAFGMVALTAGVNMLTGNDRTNQHSGSDTVGGSSSRWSF